MPRSKKNKPSGILSSPPQPQQAPKQPHNKRPKIASAAVAALPAAEAPPVTIIDAPSNPLRFLHDPAPTTHSAASSASVPASALSSPTSFALQQLNLPSTSGLSLTAPPAASSLPQPAGAPGGASIDVPATLKQLIALLSSQQQQQQPLASAAATLPAPLWPHMPAQPTPNAPGPQDGITSAWTAPLAVPHPWQMSSTPGHAGLAGPPAHLSAVSVGGWTAGSDIVGAASTTTDRGVSTPLGRRSHVTAFARRSIDYLNLNLFSIWDFLPNSSIGGDPTAMDLVVCLSNLQTLFPATSPVVSTIASAVPSGTATTHFLSTCQSVLAQLLLAEGGDALRKGFTARLIFEFTILACNKAGSPAMASAPTSRPISARNGYSFRPRHVDSNEVCRRFNDNNCPRGDSCPRRHVCLSCGGSHPQKHCSGNKSDRPRRDNAREKDRQP